MSRGVQVSENGNLVSYSTKIFPAMVTLLDTLANIRKGETGREFGQRELLEESLLEWLRADPARTAKAQRILTDLNPNTLEYLESLLSRTYTGSVAGSLKELRWKTSSEDPAPAPQNVQTLRYIGKPTIHLGENGKAACGLSGAVDPESIREDTTDQVDCKKCRYCRKNIFALQ